VDTHHPPTQGYAGPCQFAVWPSYLKVPSNETTTKLKSQIGNVKLSNLLTKRVPKRTLRVNAHRKKDVNIVKSHLSRKVIMSVDIAKVPYRREGRMAGNAHPADGKDYSSTGKKTGVEASGAFLHSFEVNPSSEATATARGGMHALVLPLLRGPMCAWVVHHFRSQQLRRCVV